VPDSVVVDVVVPVVPVVDEVPVVEVPVDEVPVVAGADCTFFMACPRLKPSTVIAS